ncbi:hypothetical protein [Rufibacter sp. XAAS-G3-1]|uniref:hypothetical protein n=1 Tax=Rufibacter sp. XAAS-G3-1 TaxID=2729134 RepID=UPI0015E691CD|nr:hypothetical protein [Rufibacter sp. XAAS-G3-1]
MFLKRWRVVFFLALVVLPQIAFPQADSLATKRLSLLISPQHLLLRGYHLDLEKHLRSSKRHSLLFSARVYAGSTRFADFFTTRKEEAQDFSYVKGAGAEVQHRIYFRKFNQQTYSAKYIAYGFSFHRFNIDFEKEGWIQERAEDGLLYYQFKYHTFTEQINRWGALVLYGTQEGFFSGRVLLDSNIGLGYNYSSTTSDYHAPRFNRNLFDYGNSGLYLYLGLKLGVVLLTK